MRAMLLKALGPLPRNPAPLELADWPDPTPGPGEVLIRVERLRRLPHRAGRDRGSDATAPAARSSSATRSWGGSRPWARGRATFRVGDRVGVAWIYSACGHCDVRAGGAKRTSATSSGRPGAMRTAGMPSG